MSKFNPESEALDHIYALKQMWKSIAAKTTALCRSKE